LQIYQRYKWNRFLLLIVNSEKRSREIYDRQS
jgi:hypothetical protein